MESNYTIDHLLKIEAKASGLVKDAEDEADRRIKDGDERNRRNFEEVYKQEIHIQEAHLKKYSDSVKKKYNEALIEYKNSISDIHTDKEKFNNLLNEYLFNEESEG